MLPPASPLPPRRRSRELPASPPSSSSPSPVRHGAVHHVQQHRFPENASAENATNHYHHQRERRPSPQQLMVSTMTTTMTVATVPYRRPSAGPPSTSTSHSAAAATAFRRASCGQWRSNTYAGASDEYHHHAPRGWISSSIASGDYHLLGGHGQDPATARPGTPVTIKHLREAMRQLARPQLQLCLGASGDCGTAATEQSQRSRHHSSSSRSPVGSPRQKQPQQQQSPVVTLATGSDLYAPVAGGARSPSIGGCTGSLMGGTGGGRRCSGTPRGRLERSNSLIAGRGGTTTLAFLPELSPQQVSNLRRSWKHINTKGLYDVIRRSFRKVECSSASVMAAFRRNSNSGGGGSDQPPPDDPDSARGGGGGCRNTAAGVEGTAGGSSVQQQERACGVMEHSKYFLVLIDRIIDGDHQEELERELKLVGARHVTVYERFGAGVAEIERTGEALAESFFKLDGIRQSKETTKVWRVLIAKIIDHIRDGFDTELRVQRRRGTNSTFVSGTTGSGTLTTPAMDSKFTKRNSMPGMRKNKSVSSPGPADVHMPLPPANTAGCSNTQNAGFLRTELANLTRKLSNL